MGETGHWSERFPALAGLDDPAWRTIREKAQVVTLPAGTTLFQEGDPCERYMLVLSGSVRVQRTAENGREITLYRVGEGESCVLTTACLLGNDHYPAEGIAESKVTGVLIPGREFQAGLAESPRFRAFVFSAYAERISTLIMLVEEVAFGRVDVRLAQLLLQRSGDADRIEATHQALATDLGTAREVVSRQLKEFERRGWIALHRGRLDLLERHALEHLAAVR